MTSAAPGATSAASNEPAFRRLLRATEVDTRMLGMIFALLLIWVGFNIYTQIQTGEGLFLTPRNSGTSASRRLRSRSWAPAWC